MTDWINSARAITSHFFAEGIYYRFPRYVKQEQLPRGSWTRLCWLLSLNSTPAAVTRNKAYPGTVYRFSVWFQTQRLSLIQS